MPIWRGATSTDWNTASNWIIDGSGNTGVPTTTTDAIFDASSTVLCTTGNTIRNCRDLITTGHTGTLQIGSGTTGDLRVYRNVTIGGTTFTGSSYLTLYSNVTTLTLNVQVGTIIPNFKVEPQVLSPTVTLTNTTVVTNYFKTEAVSGANVTYTAASAGTELRVNNVTFHNRITIMGTNTTFRFMGGTYETGTYFTGNVVLDTGATLTPVSSTGLGTALNFTGICNINFSAGTLVNPTISSTYRLGNWWVLFAGTFTINLGSNTIDTLYNSANVGQCSIILQSNLVINKNFVIGYDPIFSGGFNVIVKEAIPRTAIANQIRSNPGGKIIYQGTSTGFIGMGFISGTTLTITSVIQQGTGLGYYQMVHVPSVSAAVNNSIVGVTTYNTTYTLQFSQTVGSIGSPVMIYAYGISNMTLGSTAAGSNTVLEIDAGSNDVYFTSLVAIRGTVSELRYLSTNSGIFDGSKGGIAITSNGGVVDFQGQSSTTKFLSSITTADFFSTITLKSNLYVNNCSVIASSGITQSGGSYTLYVSGNFEANNDGTRNFQPTVELIGSTNVNFTCTNLHGNIIINKSGGAIVTVTQNFTYGYATPTTFTHTSGIINNTGRTITITGNSTFNTATMTGSSAWNNFTINTNITLTLTSTLNVNGSLLCNGNATFAGTAGWTTSGFSCTTAGSTLTFQNATANPSASYVITGALIITGTAAARIILQAAGSASFTGIANGTALTYSSGTIPTSGMTISQATGIAPTGFLNLLPNRPTITGGTSPNFTISPSVAPTTGSIAMRAGYKAIFTLANNGIATQNVAYAQTQDIDSNAGQTILSFGSNGDDTATNTALFRTLNWGPLIAPSGSVYYTFVN
jgi:hypothetical protein